MTNSTPTIRSLEATLDVLEGFLAPGGDFRGVTELSRMTGMQKNRVWRILTTLARRGYVLQDEETQKYSLGPGFLILGETFRNRLDLRRTAAPFLDELAEESGDAIHLDIKYGQEAVLIDRRLGSHGVQVTGPIGEAIPLFIGASPKIHLAFLSKRERKELLDQIQIVPLTPNTVKSREMLEGQLEQIRTLGYWVEEEDYEIGSNEVAAPVFEHTGRVVACLGIAIPRARYTPERRDRTVHLVVEAARGLSEKLGYRNSI
jgi:IclR family acetate operon transcriptional repressor